MRYDMARAGEVAVKMDKKRCVQSTAKLGPVNELYRGDGQTKVGVRDVSQVF